MKKLEFLLVHFLHKFWTMTITPIKIVKTIIERYHIRKADALLISFPKCGRTWLRLLIGKAIQLHLNLQENKKILLLGPNFSRLHDNIPKIMVFHEDRPHFKKADELNVSKKKYKDRKIIYLIRDPRDVLISNYFQKKKRRKNFKGDLKEFINWEIGSIDSILKYYQIWAENQDVINDLLLVKYEDLHKDAEAELERVLNFLGLKNISSEHISQAVEYAKFENMRKMEKKKKFDTKKKILKPGDKKDENSFKTRKGKIGDYKNHLSEQQQEEIDRKMEAMLGKYRWYKDYLD